MLSKILGKRVVETQKLIIIAGCLLFPTKLPDHFRENDWRRSGLGKLDYDSLGFGCGVEDESQANLRPDTNERASATSGAAADTQDQRQSPVFPREVGPRTGKLLQAEA
jgi:hypothetical protein